MENDQVRAIVQQLHDLCEDKTNRVSIAKDNKCLPGLTLFLDNPDPEVVHLALETLLLLSEEEDNHARMYGDINFVKPIKNVLENPNIPAKSKMVAVKLFRTIQPHQKVPSRPQGVPIPTSSGKLEGRRAVGKVPFLTVSTSAARHVRLHVAGLDDPEARARVQDSLLLVRGLVSFTFDLKSDQIDVRALDSVQLGALKAAVARVGMKVQVVVGGPNGEETYMDIVDEVALTDVDGYLDENERGNERTIMGKALAKIADQRSKHGSGWFSSMGSYLSRNLYW